IDGLILDGSTTGLEIDRASPTVRNMIIRNQSSSGLYISQTAAIFQNVHILNNHDGGVVSYDGNPTFVDCTIQGNSGHFGGLQLIVSTLPSSATVELDNCLITGNYSSDGVGGIDSQVKLTMNNCTVAGNYGGYIPGISLSYG